MRTERRMYYLKTGNINCSWFVLSQAPWPSFKITGDFLFESSFLNVDVQKNTDITEPKTAFSFLQLSL